MQEHSKQLLDQIQRVGNSYATLERKLVVAYEGIKLHASEIHFMQAVDDEPELNLTGLAQKLGVSKGAVSQTLARLQAKGIMGKESDPFNKNQLQMELTPKGRRALDAFQQRIARQWRELSSYLDGLKPGEQKTVASFMALLEDFFKRTA